MLWFCGGHGACLTPPGETTRARDTAVAWLRHYVAGDDSVTMPSTFEFVDQDGAGYTAGAFPADTGASVYANGAGTLNLVAEGGAGPSAPIGGGLGVFVAPITPARASNAVNVTVNSGEADADTVIVGAPRLIATYAGTVADGTAPTRVFAQIVDDTTGLVVGNQITPIEVTLDGQQQVLDVPLEMIAFTLHPGSTVTMQLVATTTAYATPRLGGSIDFADVEIDLPVATDITRR
jgi:ABC-2 type transport system ATP-binding protein